MRLSDWSAAPIIYSDSSQQPTGWAGKASRADANESFFRPQRTPTAYPLARPRGLTGGWPTSRKRLALQATQRPDPGRPHTRIRIRGDEPAARQPARPDVGPRAPSTDAMPFDHVVVVMMENHSFDNLLGALRALRSAEAQRADLRQRRARAATATRDADTAPVRSFPFPTTAQGAARLADLERDPRADRRRQDGRLRPLGRNRRSRWATGPRTCCRSPTRSRARSRSPTAGSARRRARPTRTGAS